MSLASARLAVVILGLALIGCQRLGGEEPVGSGGPEPEEDTGFETFLPGETDDVDDDGNQQIDCNPISQTGCNPGEKCAAIKSGINVSYICVSDSGTLEPFGSCNASLHDGLDGCPAGHVCLEGADENGACVPLCLQSSDCDDGICVYHSTDQVRHCAAECNPFGSLCVSPLQCRQASDRFVCKFPTESDVGAQGSDCLLEEDAGCTAGFACLPGPLVSGCMSPNCCTSLCDVSGPDPCAGAATCNPLFLNPAPGYDDVGACFVPA